jgi:hypothetical protein
LHLERVSIVVAAGKVKASRIAKALQGAADVHDKASGKQLPAVRGKKEPGDVRVPRLAPNGMPQDKA